MSLVYSFAQEKSIISFLQKRTGNFRIFVTTSQKINNFTKTVHTSPTTDTLHPGWTQAIFLTIHRPFPAHNSPGGKTRAALAATRWQCTQNRYCRGRALLASTGHHRNFCTTGNAVEAAYMPPQTVKKTTEKSFSTEQQGMCARG